VTRLVEFVGSIVVSEAVVAPPPPVTGGAAKFFETSMEWTIVKPSRMDVTVMEPPTVTAVMVTTPAETVAVQPLVSTFHVVEAETSVFPM